MRLVEGLVEVSAPGPRAKLFHRIPVPPGLERLHPVPVPVQTTKNLPNSTEDEHLDNLTLHTSYHTSRIASLHGTLQCIARQLLSARTCTRCTLTPTWNRCKHQEPPRGKTWGPCTSIALRATARCE